MAMSSISVREATFRLLRELGMTTVFGNPGSTELAFLDRWPQDLRYILGLQECVVVGMADGYAQATGTAAFVNLHSAAGVGHALGAIYTAYRNRTPLVITAGQQTRDLMPLRPFLGAASACEFPKPYIKWSCEPARAADVPLAIAQAHYMAMQRPCGPTFVSVPADDWSQPAEAVTVHSKARSFAADPTSLRKLAHAIDDSRKPMIVIGASVAQERAADLAVALAERMQCPVWSEALASRSGFPEQHPLFAGFLPAAPAPLARILERHDLVLVLGANAFTFHVPGDLQQVRVATTVYQITDDPELAAVALGAASILGAVGLTMASLLEEISVKARESEYVRERPARVAATDPISAEFVLQTIADLRQAGSVIVEEAPSHRSALQAHLPINDGGYHAVASGGLGYGAAAAVGLALADPSRRVICIVGDGSAMYSIQALWTAARHRLPITYVVLNNGGYGAMRAFSKLLDIQNAPGIDIPLLDFTALAQGHGCLGRRVTRATELPAALREAFAESTPTVVDVTVDAAVPSLFRN